MPEAMPKRRELHDVYFRKAKAEGYAARSAYKLLEIQERHRLLKPGQSVLDLGCAPGSWLQVASKAVGAGGRVVGVDLQAVEIPPLPNVVTVVADVFAIGPADLLKHLGGPAERFGAVISDMAPATTGAPSGDHFRSVDLCRRVLDLLPALLVPGGACVMKVFEGESYPELLRDVQGLFRFAKGLRPDATREVSREIFLIGEGYRRPAPPGAGPRDPRLAPPPPAPRPGWGEGAPA